MKMSILVSNINCRGQKELSLKVRHKAYARPLEPGLCRLNKIEKWKF